MPSGVRAHTTATSAMAPLVIHILVPESTQPVPFGMALVFMLAGSEPWSGSVRPKQPSASPVAILGSHSSFCSSEPYRQIGYIASEPCTETRLRRPVVGGLQLPAGHAVGDRPHARAAVAGQVHAEQAHLAEFRCKLAGEDAGLEPVGDVRHHLVRGVSPHGVPDQALVRRSAGPRSGAGRGLAAGPGRTVAWRILSLLSVSVCGWGPAPQVPPCLGCLLRRARCRRSACPGRAQGRLPRVRSARSACQVWPSGVAAWRVRGGRRRHCGLPCLHPGCIATRRQGMIGV